MSALRGAQLVPIGIFTIYLYTFNLVPIYCKYCLKGMLWLQTCFDNQIYIGFGVKK